MADASDGDDDDGILELVGGSSHHHHQSTRDGSGGGGRSPPGRRGGGRPRLVGVGPSWRGHRVGPGGPGGPGTALAAFWVSHTLLCRKAALFLNLIEIKKVGGLESSSVPGSSVVNHLLSFPFLCRFTSAQLAAFRVRFRVRTPVDDDVEAPKIGAGVVDPQSVHPNPEVAAAVTAGQPSGPQPSYAAASKMEFVRPKGKVIEDSYEEICHPHITSTTAPTTITPTTITNTTIDMTAAEAVAAAEEAGAGARAAEAAEGAARRQRWRDGLSWEVSGAEWAPTAAGLTQIANDHVDATLGRWRESGTKSPFVPMKDQNVPAPSTAAPTPTTVVGTGATARLQTLFSPGTPAPTYSNLETPVVSSRSGAIPRRPLWPEESWLGEVTPTLRPSGIDPAKDPCAGTPLGDLVPEVSDLADLSVNPSAGRQVGAVREDTLWDTVASFLGGPVHYANVERKAASSVAPTIPATEKATTEAEISPPPARPNRRVLLLEKKKRSTKKWDPSVPLRRGRSAGPPPDAE